MGTGGQRKIFAFIFSIINYDGLDNVGVVKIQKMAVLKYLGCKLLLKAVEEDVCVGGISADFP